AEPVEQLLKREQIARVVVDQKYARAAVGALGGDALFGSALDGFRFSVHGEIAGPAIQRPMRRGRRVIVGESSHVRLTPNGLRRRWMSMPGRKRRLPRKADEDQAAT